MNTTITTKPGRVRALVGPILLITVIIRAVAGGPVDLGSLQPGDCVFAEGLSAPTPELFSPTFIRWDDMSQVQCQGEGHNGTVIGKGIGAGCDDVFNLYIESVDVPSDIVLASSGGNCVVFAEQATVIGNYVGAGRR